MHIEEIHRPNVSVIIPCFNAEKTLLRAISSVQNQTISNIELIVIDGVSTDESISIIQNLTIAPTHFIIEKDKGVYDAINKGLDLATGKWVFILGADDALTNKTVLESMLEGLGDEDQIVFGYVENEGRANRFVPLLHKSSFGRKLIWRNTLHQQSVLYRRELFEKFRFNTLYKILGDYDFHLALHSQKIQGVFRDVILSKCGSSGLSKNFKFSLYAEELKIKYHRLPLIYFLLNIPWVMMKYLGKKIG